MAVCKACGKQDCECDLNEEQEEYDDQFANQARYSIFCLEMSTLVRQAQLYNTLSHRCNASWAKTKLSPQTIRLRKLRRSQSKKMREMVDNLGARLRWSHTRVTRITLGNTAIKIAG